MNSVCLQPIFCSIPVLSCFGQSRRSLSHPAWRVPSTSIVERRSRSRSRACACRFIYQTNPIRNRLCHVGWHRRRWRRRIPVTSIILDRLHLPLVIAHKQSAGLGPGAQTDRVVEPGRELLLVNDVTANRRTKALMYEALRKAEPKVNFTFVVFQYGIFDAVMRQQDL